MALPDAVKTFTPEDQANVDTWLTSTGGSQLAGQTIEEGKIVTSAVLDASTT